MESSYNSIAGMYDRYWANWYLPAALPALEQLFFDVIPPNARVLDVCCGSGHVTGELVRRGYDVTGVDMSRELLARASKRWPRAQFLVEDVRQLQLSATYDAALSTFDSLNHLLTLRELEAAFRGVRAALRPSGIFVFDMNGEEAWTLDLHSWNVTVEDDSVSLVRGKYDPKQKLATTELVWFVQENGAWQRHSSKVLERCYTQQEICNTLEDAGFKDIETWTAAKAGVQAELGFGRWFFRARP